MANKFAGMDINQAVKVFTQSLMLKLTEGHPVKNEEIEALNAVRESAGLKPINISIPDEQKSAPSQQQQKSAPPPPKQQYQQRRAPRKPSHEQENESSYEPTSLMLNGRHTEGQMLTDNSQWTNRFYIKSESSGRLYTVSQNKNRRFWACSCPGWIGHRRCKHLAAMGLPGGEQPFEAQLSKGASAKTAAAQCPRCHKAMPSIGDEVATEQEYKAYPTEYCPNCKQPQLTGEARFKQFGPRRSALDNLAHHLAAELMHSDDDLSMLMSPVEETLAGAHIEGPEAGASNDELHENSHEESGVPVTDGDIKSPERQNVNAIREAIETQAEMEVGKPIEVKQDQIEKAVVNEEAALNAGQPAGGVSEVTAKPGTQIVINVASAGEVEGIGGENQPGATAGHAGGMFGGSDLEGPSFHVGFTFRGEKREASFSTMKEAHSFIKSASAKFGKIAGDWSMKCPSCGEYASKANREDEYKCKCGWSSQHTASKQASVKVAVNRVAEAAERLMLIENDVWDKLGIQSGGDISQKPDLAANYKADMLAALKANRIGRVSQAVLNALTNENYHTLVKLLTENGMTKTSANGNVVELPESENPVNSIVEAVFVELLNKGIASTETPRELMARAVSTLKTRIKKQKQGDKIIYSVFVKELNATYKLVNPSSLQAIDDFKQNPYKDKIGAADPAKRNLVMEILKSGPKTTGEIEKALGGGKYTTKAWPILNELTKEGLLSHKQMRWSLKASSKTAEWKGWTETMPVEVVGNATGMGAYEVFPNLAEAKKKYPTLDPRVNGNEFTWAMHGKIKGQDAIRFETWEAYKHLSASVKSKVGFTVETRVTGEDSRDILGDITAKLKTIFQSIKQQNPEGFMDSFEQQLPTRMTEIAGEFGLRMDYNPTKDAYMFFDQMGAGTKDKNFEEFEKSSTEEKWWAGCPEHGKNEFPSGSCHDCAMLQPAPEENHMSALKAATIKITSAKPMPQKGTPEWKQLDIAVKTMKMPDEMIGVMGGPDKAESERILAMYGLVFDERAYLAGGPGVKRAGEGKAMTEEQLEKEAGFNFFFPGQVVKEFYPELQHEIVDYPNASNSPMGMSTPEIVGDGGHELEGVLDEALGNQGIVEMIQLPADVGEVEPLAFAASKSAADYVSTSPAGGMGIGRDGKPEVLEGAPLRKENDIRGYMFTDEFYGQYDGIPGAALTVASKTAAEGDENKQFGLFLKKVCGEIAATLVAAFKVTTRPLLDKVPGVGEVQLDQVEQVQNPAFATVIQGGSRVKYLMDKLNDGDIKQAINDAWAQAAVWNDNPDGGFVYEVFVRPETIDTDSLKMKYKFICGTRES